MDRKSLGDKGVAHVGRELKLKALRGAHAALRDLPGVKRLKNNVHTKARAEAQEDLLQCIARQPRPLFDVGHCHCSGKDLTTNLLFSVITGGSRSL